MQKTAEHKRLQEHKDRKANWKKWGPYLSERAWGTVREDCSADGSAWDYFTHDHACSRAYRSQVFRQPGFNRMVVFSSSGSYPFSGFQQRRRAGFTVAGHPGPDRA